MGPLHSPLPAGDLDRKPTIITLLVLTRLVQLYLLQRGLHFSPAEDEEDESDDNRFSILVVFSQPVIQFLLSPSLPPSSPSYLM